MCPAATQAEIEQAFADYRSGRWHDTRAAASTRTQRPALQQPAVPPATSPHLLPAVLCRQATDRLNGGCEAEEER